MLNKEFVSVQMLSPKLLTAHKQVKKLRLMKSQKKTCGIKR